MREWAVGCSLLASLVAGCTGRLTRAGVDREQEDASGASTDAACVALDGASGVAPSVILESPDDGAVFVRDEIVDGAFGARVHFVVRASGVTRLELRADETFLLGEPDASGRFEHVFFADGERILSAVGFGETGEEVARDQARVRIEPPLDDSCHGMLDSLGLDWAPATPTRGIADPVRVQPVIRGIRFRPASSAEPRAMLMDCELGVRLHALAGLLAPYGIDEVIHLGIYNYRCIGGGDPESDACTPSQHALGRAIDLHAFGLAEADEVLDVEADWVVIADSSCPMPSSSEKDRILKEIACAMWADGLFQIVLTPNYNAAHRNHLHVDLTAGSMFLGVGVEGVDPRIPALGH